MDWEFLKEKLNKYEIDYIKVNNFINNLKKDHNLMKGIIDNYFKISDDLKIIEFITQTKKIGKKISNIKNLYDFQEFIKLNRFDIDKFYDDYSELITNLEKPLFLYFFSFVEIIDDLWIFQNLINDSFKYNNKYIDSKIRGDYLFKLKFKEIMSFFELSKSKYEFLSGLFLWSIEKIKIENIIKKDSNYWFELLLLIFQNKDDYLKRFNEYYLENYGKFIKKFNKFKINISIPKLWYKKNIEFESYSITHENMWYKKNEFIFKTLRDQRNILEHTFSQKDILNIYSEFVDKKILNIDLLNMPFQYFKIALILFFDFLIEINKKIINNAKKENNIFNNFRFDNVKNINDLYHFFIFLVENNFHEKFIYDFFVNSLKC